jgi:SAM-dependent methyltransferase
MKKITLRILEIFKTEGTVSVLKKILAKVIYIRIREFKLIRSLFANKAGLEVGGPSALFDSKAYIPLYPIVQSLDGCNFSGETIWEGKINSTIPYRYFNSGVGTQYISEATNLQMLRDECYDFIISCHCLEHVANPLKALSEWLRVLKRGGVILLILPDKKHTFDHRRPLTLFDHLLQDFQSDIGEDDLTHLEEILSLHDLNLDKPAGTLEFFKTRSLKNFYNRTLHHHIFDISLLKKIYAYFNLEIILAQTHNGNHIILGRKR